MQLDLASRDPDEDEGLNDIAYEKGCLLLLALEQLVGHARLDAFIKEYFARFSFQRLDPDQFVAYLTRQLLGATRSPAPTTTGVGHPPMASY